MDNLFAQEKQDLREELAPTDQSFFVLFRRAISFAAPHRNQIAGILGLTVATAAMEALDPLLMKYLFDSLGSGKAYSAFGLAVLGLIVLGVSRQGLGGCLNWLAWHVRIGVNTSMQRAVVERLCSLPLSFFRSASVGGIITQMNRGISGCMDVFGEVTTRVLSNVIYLAMSLGAMFVLDRRLFALAVLFAPLPSLIGAWAAREQTERERALLSRWTRIFAHFYEVLAGIATVKSFARESAEGSQFMLGVCEANKIVMRGVARDSATDAVNTLIVTCGRVAIAAFGGYLVMKGEITVGTVVAFLGYIGGLFGPVQGLTGTYQTFRRASVSLNAVFEILDAPDPLKDSSEAREIEFVRGEVKFENVTFAYGAGPPILRGINLHVRHGEMIALVGPSGAGKTTLISLLQRFDDPVAGNILVDGINIRSIRKESLCRQIGFVLQDNMLFDDTVRNNIAYGNPGASMRDVEAAALAANAHEFICRLPQGYESMVGEGGKCLSFGQRQRIAIARALLKDPPILILDEATSALDAECEMQIQQALSRLIRGRTTFIIAHRLQTVVRADRIVVLKKGRIVEMGSHDHLMHMRGYYSSLVKKQTRGLLITHQMAA